MSDDLDNVDEEPAGPVDSHSVDRARRSWLRAPGLLALTGAAMFAVLDVVLLVSTRMHGGPLHGRHTSLTLDPRTALATLSVLATGVVALEVRARTVSTVAPRPAHDGQRLAMADIAAVVGIVAAMVGAAAACSAGRHLPGGAQIAPAFAAYVVTLLAADASEKAASLDGRQAAYRADVARSALDRFAEVRRVWVTGKPSKRRVVAEVVGQVIATATPAVVLVAAAGALTDVHRPSTGVRMFGIVVLGVVALLTSTYLATLLAVAVIDRVFAIPALFVPASGLTMVVLGLGAYVVTGDGRAPLWFNVVALVSGVWLAAAPAVVALRWIYSRGRTRAPGPVAPGRGPGWLAEPAALRVVVARHIDGQTETWKRIQARAAGDEPRSSNRVRGPRAWYRRASGQLPPPRPRPGPGAGPPSPT